MGGTITFRGLPDMLMGIGNSETVVCFLFEIARLRSGVAVETKDVAKSRKISDFSIESSLFKEGQHIRTVQGKDKGDISCYTEGRRWQTTRMNKSLRLSSRKL
jgi:hypothetical protein